MKITYQSTLNKTIGGAVGLAAYRVAQESLTNALKHAPGEHVDVSLSGELNEMRLTIVNKMHSTPTAAPGGHGLRNMRERAASVGGQVDFRWDGRLWTVTLRIPTGIEPRPQTRSE
jgi:signal transduction histidine kinase